MALDDLSVELDSPLLRRATPPPAAGMSLAEGLAPLAGAFVPESQAPRYAPTRGERRRWSGSTKFSTGSTASEVRSASEGEAEKVAERAADLARYEALKEELATYTLGVAGATTVVVAGCYGAEITASYALGVAGGLFYLRLLSRSVDNTALAEPTVTSVLETTLGGQRLLVPAILVAGWNRWNALAAPTVGFELHFAPMLAGFFVYKTSAIVQLFRDVFPDVGKRRQE